MSSELPPLEQEATCSAVECVQQISRLLQQLEVVGLLYSPTHPLSADAVEHILITDEWSCKKCGKTELRTCPETGKPHRRHLVRVAQDILRLIGYKTGQLVVRPPNLSSSINGRSRLRSQRRVTMNPQALLLAYYYAVLPSNEVDGLVSDCAQHLVELLEQLKVYGAQEGIDEGYTLALLSSTSLLWNEYSRKMAENLRPLKGADRRACKAVLVNGTREAYVAASRELCKSPSNDKLQAFVTLLHDRLERLISQEDLQELETSVYNMHRNEEEEEEEEEEEAEEGQDQQGGTKDERRMRNQDGDECVAEGEEGEVAAFATAVDGVVKKNDKRVVRKKRSNDVGHGVNLQLTAPPLLLSDGNTSGSEAEGGAPPVVMGPALPPDWYVDEQGRSRPPQMDEMQRRRETFSRLEFRARKAYETVIKVQEPKSDPLRERIVSSLNEAQLKLLAEQCNHHPPDLQSVPHFLNLVTEGLLNALPRRLRGQAEQEMRDVLDWRIVRRSVMGSPGNIAALMRYVMGKVAEYGAAAKAEETLKLAEDMGKSLEACTPDLGTAVANAFRLMLSSIRQLHEDVAQFSLLFITEQLRDNGVQFIREFISECLPKVEQWESSLAFVRCYFNDERVKAWANSPAAVSSTALTLDERHLRGSLLYGLVDLLRSSGLQAADRWHKYPAECFFFEKNVVFFAANTVQENTLLLLLSGSISTILRGKGLSSASINDILKQLHEKFRRLFSEQLTLPYLKTSVTSIIDEALEERKQIPPLTPNEVSQLHGAVEKMTDTTGSLYAAFEKRIATFIEAIIAHGQKDPPPIGLVTDSLHRLAALLQHALAFNWEIYQPFYKVMLPLVSQDKPADV